MGKINVSLLRYLNAEDYRVLTAVICSLSFLKVHIQFFAHLFILTVG